MPAAFRIDVHHHPSPPSYASTRGQDKNWKPGDDDWSVQKTLDSMNEGSVATSMLSLPHAAQIWPGDRTEARRLARDWNEFMSRMAQDHPGRFGVFASLPILDIEGSLLEIEHAFGVLKVDGVTLMTNIGDRWLGDVHYAPVFEELNRRGAIVYTHPVAPDCCRGLLAQTHDSVIEYATDTTRAIAQLLFSGSAARYPKIRFIFSHAGGTMPFLAQRFINAHRFARGDAQANLPDGVLPALNRFYYDTAQAAHPYAMSSFRQVVQLSQLLFGTDFPYVSAALTAKGLQSCGFAEQELAGIYRGNAVRLLPRLDA